MEKNKQLVGVKKRQQIIEANKMIFVWVIVASIVISLCGVTIQFLFRQASFNQKVIGEKAQTQSILATNVVNAEQLKTNVKNLLADANLAKVKANPTDTNLTVVLDALPTEDNKSALGASLQQVILPKSGVSTTELSTISAGDAENSTATTQSGAQSSMFSFAIAGNYDQTKTTLRDLELTIRPINVTALTVQSTDGKLRTTVNGSAYYSPQQTLQLGKKTIKP